MKAARAHLPVSRRGGRARRSPKTRAIAPLLPGLPPPLVVPTAAGENSQEDGEVLRRQRTGNPRRGRAVTREAGIRTWGRRGKNVAGSAASPEVRRSAGCRAWASPPVPAGPGGTGRVDRAAELLPTGLRRARGGLGAHSVPPLTLPPGRACVNRSPL